MSKKGKKGKKVGTCLGCGASLRARQRKCRRCGRPSPLFTAKAARRPYLVKGGNVVPLARPSCWNGCPPGQRGHRHCTSCGEPYGLTIGQHTQRVFKAMNPARDTYWGREFYRETDPVRAEQIWYAMHPELKPKGPAA